MTTDKEAEKARKKAERKAIAACFKAINNIKMLKQGNTQPSPESGSDAKSMPSSVIIPSSTIPVKQGTKGKGSVGITADLPKLSESKLQQICVRWFYNQYPNELLFAIPNGGKRGIITATIMKAEGVRKGIPDLLLAKPRRYWDEYLKDYVYDYGLFVEMKADKGRLQPEQKEIHGKLVESGYHVAVCYSFEDFKLTIENYLR